MGTRRDSTLCYHHVWGPLQKVTERRAVSDEVHPWHTLKMGHSIMWHLVLEHNRAPDTKTGKLSPIQWVAYEVTCFKSFTPKVIASNQITWIPLGICTRVVSLSFNSYFDPIVLETLLFIFIRGKLELGKDKQYSSQEDINPDLCDVKASTSTEDRPRIAKMMLQKKKKQRKSIKRKSSLTIGAMPRWAITRSVEVSLQRLNNLCLGRPVWERKPEQDGCYNLFQTKML